MVGGERWWQVRGLDGVDAEWITDKKLLREDEVLEEGKQKITEEDRKLSDNDTDILRMDSLERVLVSII